MPLEYGGFSTREKIQKSDSTVQPMKESRTDFANVLKMNPYHGEGGKFTDKAHSKHGKATDVNHSGVQSEPNINMYDSGPYTQPTSFEHNQELARQHTVKNGSIPFEHQLVIDGPDKNGYVKTVDVSTGEHVDMPISHLSTDGAGYVRVLEQNGERVDTHVSSFTNGNRSTVSTLRNNVFTKYNLKKSKKMDSRGFAARKDLL